MDVLLQRAAGSHRVADAWADEVPALVSRPRLLERMRRAADARSTVLAAPAGFGKTVLVGQWAARHAASPVAWLALRSADGARTVAARLVTAARGLGADVRPAGRGWCPESASGLGARFVDELVARLAAVGDAVLVLDGLDTLADPALVNELGVLPDQLPHGLHVVVTRRSRWTPARHRLRGGGDTVTFDATDLAFTSDEVRLLVRQLANRDLTDGQLDALLARTAGWPVALHVAAMALRGPGHPDDVIERISGNDRHIAAFLHEEVLDRQTPRLRRFLVHTSTLDTLSASLCAAVTGEPRAGMILRLLEHRGAFVQRVDDDGRVLVHHPLFRDMLRGELRVAEPEVEARLLANAARWYRDHGEPGRAASCLIEAEDWEQLLDLLDREGRVLFERGRASDMLRWLDAIPGGTGRRHDVVIRRAYVLTMLGRTREAEQVLRELTATDTSPGERAAVAALRATWAFIDGPLAPAAEAAEEALTTLDGLADSEVPDILGMTAPANLRMMAAGSRARAMWLAGDVAGGRQGLLALAGQPEAYEPWRTHVLSALALLEAWAGNLCLAQRHAHHALALAARAGLADHPATLDAYLAIAHASRERGDLLRALESLSRAHRIAVRMRRPVSLAVHAVERALWYVAAGRPERALQQIEVYRSKGYATPPPIVERRLRAIEARLLLVLRGPEQAELVVGNTAGSHRAPELTAVAVQTALARRDVTAAQRLLDYWEVPGGDPRGRLEHELWAAIIDFESGRRRPALQRAASLVADAGAEGHLRLFLDAGHPAERLLRALLAVEPTPYLRNLVQGAGWSGGTTGQLGVGLSQREREVVRYLPTPLSSAQIAAKLYISLNTLKTHLRTIYRKLDVSDRREAIARLQSLGLA